MSSSLAPVNLDDRRRGAEHAAEVGAAGVVCILGDGDEGGGGARSGVARRPFGGGSLLERAALTVQA